MSKSKGWMHFHCVDDDPDNEWIPTGWKPGQIIPRKKPHNAYFNLRCPETSTDLVGWWQAPDGSVKRAGRDEYNRLMDPRPLPEGANPYSYVYDELPLAEPEAKMAS